MIEDKLSRLTQEQRREVEEFIDFLMSRDRDHGQIVSSGTSGGYLEIGDFSDHKKDTLFGRDHESSGSSGDDILPGYPEYGDMGSLSGTNESHPARSVTLDRPVSRKTNRRDPSQLLDWLD